MGHNPVSGSDCSRVPLQWAKHDKVAFVCPTSRENVVKCIMAFSMLVPHHIHLLFTPLTVHHWKEHLLLADTVFSSHIMCKAEQFVGLK